MIKKALILSLALTCHALIQNPLKTDYDGRLHYPSRPEEFHDLREAHWAEVYFYYDAQCSTSIEKKMGLEKYFRKHNQSIGKG